MIGQGELIATRRLRRTYRQGSQDVDALVDATATIERGEFLSIMGRSGSGKSTLLHLLGMLDVASGGSYRFGGRDVAELSVRERSRLRADRIGFIFQTFHLLDDLTVLENVQMPFAYRPGPSQEAKRLSRLALDRVGLSHRLRHRSNQLSGGEMQRTAIARALAGAPDVILADEPTGNLDDQTGGEILDLLEGLRDEGVTVVVVTHDAEVARRADRSLLMTAGVLTES